MIVQNNEKIEFGLLSNVWFPFTEISNHVAWPRPSHSCIKGAR